MVSPAFLPPPPPPAPPKTSLPMLYYGLIVVGTASIVLALYNLIVLRWCADRRTLPPERQNPFAEMGRIGNGNGNSNSNSNGNGNGTGVVLPASFRYKKEMAKGDGEGDSECAVCLSAFEEGEEIRRLPRCRHAFHAQCIDMWLFSHADCPLCRAPLAPARRCGRHASAEEEEGSREVLIVVNPVVAV